MWAQMGDVQLWSLHLQEPYRMPVNAVELYQMFLYQTVKMNVIKIINVMVFHIIKQLKQQHYMERICMV